MQNPISHALALMPLLGLLALSSAGCKGGGAGGDPTPEPVTGAEPVTGTEPATHAEPTPAEDASPAPGELSETLAAALKRMPADGPPPPELEGADIEAGRRTYEGLCASCHGPGGKGDGPAAASLDPRPADWSHPDGHGRTTPAQKAWLIKNGVGGGSAMPPFEAALSPAQIGNVLTVVEGFGPAPAGAPQVPAGGPAKNP